ncbi:MAG: hypothetical protein LQ337_008192 [Flavoplaca oasis]|nr:MAG: hypothetical protein LQ337_008192 [Flavoplaca oasis]
MAFLPFPPGTILHDPSTPAGAVWKRVLNDVSRAQGYCGQHWGYHVEEPGQVWYLVDWESVEAHTTYSTTPAYADINEALFPLLAPAPPAALPRMFHVRFQGLSGVWDEDAVKVSFFYMDNDRDMPAIKTPLVAAALEQVRLLEDKMIGGWALEAMPSSSKDDRERRLFVLAQPWNGQQGATMGDDDVSTAVYEALNGLSIHNEESTLRIKR